jgi:CheY-like chemotaxis protein
MSTVEAQEEIMDVLLVEDNPGDVRLARESFRNVNRCVRLHLAADGMEAMAFLRQEGAHTHAPRPDLILLDLNLPKMDGRQVLEKIKTDNILKIIPTIVLSSSEAEADVMISYQLQANCYLRKPAQWDAFDSLVRDVSSFWLAKPKLPRPISTG